MLAEIKNTSDFSSIVGLIKDAQYKSYQFVNATLVQLYYQIGKTVFDKISSGSWGDSVVKNLAQHIDNELPTLKGFNVRGLYRMKQFYETYYQSKIVSTVLTQISWSQHLALLSKTKTIEEKEFYITLVVNDKLSVRELERQIDSCYYERSNHKNLIVSSLLTQLETKYFKDKYVLEFLNLPEKFSEKDLQKGIIENLKSFILEFGKGFAFVGNEYRIQVGNHDYYLDLLFYHRDLNCLVMIELKTEEFKPEFMGKMNFYLEALDRNVKKENENQSIGILLCKGKDTEVVEFAMARNTSPMMISEYETKLIDKKILLQKLHEFSELAKQELNQ
ncbi:MAG: DUF1016 domain-containing protein [Cytophagales bacterium]|nr:MAG: DUF1016 domain-containing protein [Cytophagales bacterium]